MELVEREVVNGKPYGGARAGRCCVINKVEPEDEDVRLALDNLKSLDPGLEWRQITETVRPPWPGGLFVQCTAVGVKGIVWGRAFKVKRLFKKGARRSTKKVWICGKRKRKRA